jgi:hypothetical protein
VAVGRCAGVAGRAVVIGGSISAQRHRDEEEEETVKAGVDGEWNCAQNASLLSPDLCVSVLKSSMLTRCGE